jgi:glyoxylase I family protein
MITGVHHLSIIASSEESIIFYSSLGFLEYKRVEREYDTVVIMNGHGIDLEIFIDPTDRPRTSLEPLGLRLLSFCVNKIEDTVEELGLEAGPIMTDWIGKRFCFITDPDGWLVQLHE